jgi:hypothetical protein
MIPCKTSKSKLNYPFDCDPLRNALRHELALASLTVAALLSLSLLVFILDSGLIGGLPTSSHRLGTLVDSLACLDLTLVTPVATLIESRKKLAGGFFAYPETGRLAHSRPAQQSVSTSHSPTKTS